MQNQGIYLDKLQKQKNQRDQNNSVNLLAQNLNSPSSRRIINPSDFASPISSINPA